MYIYSNIEKYIKYIKTAPIYLIVLLYHYAMVNFYNRNKLLSVCWQCPSANKSFFFALSFFYSSHWFLSRPISTDSYMHNSKFNNTEETYINECFFSPQKWLTLLKISSQNPIMMGLIIIWGKFDTVNRKSNRSSNLSQHNIKYEV